MDRVESSLKSLFRSVQSDSNLSKTNFNKPSAINKTTNIQNNKPTNATEKKSMTENTKNPNQPEVEVEGSDEDPSSLLTRILIEALHGKYSWSVASAMDYLSYSYLSIFVPVTDIERSIRASFAYLIENEFVTIEEKKQTNETAEIEPKYMHLSLNCF